MIMVSYGYNFDNYYSYYNYKDSQNYFVQDEDKVVIMDSKAPPFSETWGALEKMVEAGKCKNIGLSNFNIAQVLFDSLSA